MVFTPAPIAVDDRSYKVPGMMIVGALIKRDEFHTGIKGCQN